MKKIFLLLALLLLLTSCGYKEVEPLETYDKSEIVAEAVSLYDEHKLLPALDKALQAPEYTDCQRIIASVTGAYKNSEGLLLKSFTVPSHVQAVELSENGSFLAVSDGTAIYLADYDKAEIVATLPYGDFWFENDTLYIVGDESYAFDTYGNKLNIISEKKPDNLCEYNGKVYRVSDGVVTDGEWATEYETVDGYLSIFPLDHETYNTEGDVVPYHSVVVANGRRLTAFDRDNGNIVFDTELNDDIITCKAGNGVVVIGTSTMLSAGGQLFSNKANSPLFPEGDTLRLSENYKFSEARQSISYIDGKIATAAVGSNEVELLFKVNYDRHRKLSIEAKYPTAIADHDGKLAVGTYEYVDGKRYNWFIEYDLTNDTHTKAEIDHAIEDIYYADGWQICGDGEITAIGGVAQYKTQPTILAGADISYGDKTVTIPNGSGVLTDSEGGSVDIGFALSDMSEISYADSDTLFITEYRYSGKAVLVDLHNMKIKAEVENGIYFVKSANAILYAKGSNIGLYEYHGSDFSHVDKEWIK